MKKYNIKALNGVKNFKGKTHAFTLAEILVTLIIIGVVATLTTPVVLKNIKRNIIEKKLVSVVSILNNAIRMAEADYGGMSNWDLTAYSVTGANNSQTIALSREKIAEFFNKYFKPYLKTINDDFSERRTLKSIGYNKPWIFPDGKVLLNLNSSLSPIILNNGTVLVPSGGSFTNKKTGEKSYVWLTIFVDLDGPKGSNTVGKDIFQFQIPLKSGLSLGTSAEYDTRNRITGKFYQRYTDEEIETSCKTGKTPNNGNGYIYCSYLIKKNGWKIPKDYPWL